MVAGKQTHIVIERWRGLFAGSGPDSGRRVGAGIHLEVADDGFAGGCGAPRDNRRMAAHRFAALALTTLGRDPCRMGVKANNVRL
jgi:hypothetical protein